MISVNIQIIMDGLKTFSEHNKEITLNTQNSFNDTLKVLNDKLKESNTFENRNEIMTYIKYILDEVRKEAKENRSATPKNIAFLGAAGAAVPGAAGIAGKVILDEVNKGKKIDAIAKIGGTIVKGLTNIAVSFFDNKFKK